MSLKHIMLGLLAKPHSGYECKKSFEQSLRYFWRAELSQIYPLLQKMEKEGLLTSKESPSKIGPTKRAYKRSQKGKQELLAWLNEGPTLGTERISYLAQIWFLAEFEDTDQALEFMQFFRKIVAERLATLESIEEQWREDDTNYPDNLPDDQFYPQLTLDHGLRKARFILEWCDESIKRIKARNKKQIKTA